MCYQEIADSINRFFLSLADKITLHFKNSNNTDKKLFLLHNNYLKFHSQI